MSERAQSLYSLENAQYLRIQGYVLSMVQETVPASSMAQNSRTLQHSLAAAVEFAGLDFNNNRDLEDEMHTRFASAMDFYGGFKKSDWTNTEFSYKQRLERLSDFFLSLTKILNRTTQETVNKKLERFIYNYRQVSDQRLFGRSRGDRFIWVPMTARQGDQVCIIRGASVPHIIRLQSNGNYKMVGECWVEDFMNGQSLSLPGFQWTELCLE
jgi:hypothetical protein